MTEAPPGDGLAGRVLAGRYRLDRLVAAGGMAQVWEATDQVLARSVAVKILHPYLAADAAFVERFRREAIAAARLAHPSIVSVYDTCSDGDLEAIVMELVNGTTLRKLLDERHTLETGQAVAVVAQAADALGVAHRAGIVHRDVKPANILLSNDGRVLVADFGIAKAAGPGGSDLTGTGATLGTVKYLSPEQVEGRNIDARTDVYALGVVLYECICGRPPFSAETDAATALARLHQEPMRPGNVRGGVPKPVEDVVLRALSREPSGRYATASDMRAALLAATRGAMAPAAPPIPLHVSENGDATVALETADSTAVATESRGTTSTPPGGTPAVVPSGGGWRNVARRRGPLFVAALCAAALIVVALLVSGGSKPKTGTPSAASSSTDLPSGTILGAGALQATAYDPFSNDGENDADAPKAVDGDPSTAWSTEGYDSRTFGTKPGVGLVISIPKSRALRAITIVSPTNDWSIQLFVADSLKPALADWAAPVNTAHGISTGTHSFDLKGAKGAAVLIWITELGDDGSSAGPPGQQKKGGDEGDQGGSVSRFHARVAEVTVTLA